MRRSLFLIFTILIAMQPVFAVEDYDSALKGAFFSSDTIDTRDSSGRTALMTSIRKQDNQTARYLLEAGADPQLTDKNGQNALLYTLQFSDDTELLRLLLEKINTRQGNLHTKDHNGRTALDLFIARGRNPSFLPILRQAYDESVSAQPEKNLLFQAIQREDSFSTAVLEDLVRMGHSLNDRNQEGRTPFEEAVFTEQVAAAEVLEQIRNNLSEELIQSLYYNGSAVSLEDVEKSVSLGASSSYRSLQGFTPCHYAVAAGRPDILNLLLASEPGINPFAEDNRDIMELILFFPLDYEKEAALELMNSLLDLGLPVNIRDEEGQTLLNAGIRHSEEMALLLLHRGADPALRNPGAVSPMMTALTRALKPESSLLQELAAGGADLDARDDRGLDIISYAILYGQTLPVIKKLIDLGIDPDARDDYGTPGFFWAAAFSPDVEVIGYLLAGDNRHEWRDKDGWTPLMGALNFLNTPQAVDTLASLYNDGRMRDGFGRNLKDFRQLYSDFYKQESLPRLESLIRSRRIYPAASIPYASDLDEELRYILEYGSDPQMISLFIEEGADPGHFYSDGFTPLMAAAAFNSALMVQELLDAGAPVFDSTPYGWTPLHLAAWQNHSETALLLMEAGWDVNVRDFENWTPLHWAARNGSDFEYLQTLFRRGADPLLRTFRNDSPLHLACSSWVEPDARGLSLLLDKGTDPNALNALGESALILAAGMGYTGTCRLLLDRGADPTVADSQGETASMRAWSNGHSELAEILSAAER
ncbi:MAG: ankyrin repeat domain-containing protein [Spirochaetales bacterium]|nr:ankyrin repeat domain-containing protein [Spirochaetales bacterium]